MNLEDENVRGLLSQKYNWQYEFIDVIQMKIKYSFFPFSFVNNYLSLCWIGMYRKSLHVFSKKNEQDSLFFSSFHVLSQLEL